VVCFSSPPFGGVSIKSAPTAVKLSSSALRLSSLRWDKSTATSSPNLAAISSSVRPEERQPSVWPEDSLRLNSPFVSGRKMYSKGTQHAGTMMKTR